MVRPDLDVVKPTEPDYCSSSTPSPDVKSAKQHAGLLTPSGRSQGLECQ